MKISFVVPGSIHEISGGHIYNREIAGSFLSENGSIELLYGKNRDEIIKILSDPHEILLIDAWCLHKIDPDVLNQNFHLLVHHPIELDPSLHEKNFSEKVFWNKAKSIIVTSEEVRIFLKGKTQRPLNVVVPGIKNSETTKKHSLLPSVIAGFGSYIERKGDLLLIEALKLSGSEIIIHRYGPVLEPEFLASLKSLIAEYELSERFLIHEMISDEEKLKIFHSADLMVYPTQYESFGMAIQESLSFGIPVLTNAGIGLENRFGDKGIRYLAQNPNAWAKGLKTYCTNVDEYSILCREFNEYHIKWPSWKEQAEKIYNLLIL